ncbi:MAG: hypothetical protein QOD45_1200 [Pseudonocardiales bacterium]|nr:hypothetical protein [Pseudonocardiales bacterium]
MPKVWHRHGETISSDMARRIALNAQGLPIRGHLAESTVGTSFG